MKIQFIDSPTGQPHYLAYNAGEILELPDGLAEKLILQGIAEKYENGDFEKKSRVLTQEKATKRGSNKAIQGDDATNKRANNLK